MTENSLFMRYVNHYNSNTTPLARIYQYENRLSTLSVVVLINFNYLAINNKCAYTLCLGKPVSRLVSNDLATAEMRGIPNIGAVIVVSFFKNWVTFASFLKMLNDSLRSSPGDFLDLI